MHYFVSYQMCTCDEHQGLNLNYMLEEGHEKRCCRFLLSRLGDVGDTRLAGKMMIKEYLLPALITPSLTMVKPLPYSSSWWAGLVRSHSISLGFMLFGFSSNGSSKNWNWGEFGFLEMLYRVVVFGQRPVLLSPLVYSCVLLLGYKKEGFSHDKVL